MELCWFCNELVDEVKLDFYNNPLCAVCFGTDEVVIEEDRKDED